MSQDLKAQIAISAVDESKAILERLDDHLEQITKATEATSQAMKHLDTAQVQAAAATKKTEAATQGATKAVQEAASAATKVASATKQAESATKNATDATQKSKTATQEAASTAARLSDVLQRVSATARAAATAASAAGERISGFSSHVSGGISRILDFGNKLGGTIFALQEIGQVAASVATSLLGPAMSAEENTIAFTGLLGSVKAAKEMMSRLSTFANSTPFEFSELTTTTQRFLQMKWSTDQSMDALQILGDAVSHFGKKAPELDSVSWALQQISNSGKVASDDLNQIADAGLPAWQLLADGMHVSVAEARDLVERGLVPADKGIQAILNSAKQYKGSMKAMSESTSGMWSSLMDTAHKTMELFGTSILTPLKGTIGQLTAWLQKPEINKFAEMLGKNIAGGLDAVGKFLMTSVIPGMQQFSVLAGKVMNIVNDEGLGILIGSFQTLGDTIATVIQPALQPMIDGLSSLFTESNVIGGAQSVSVSFYDIAAAIDNVSKFVASLPGHFENVRKTMQPVADFVIATFMPAWNQLASTFQSQLVPAWNDLVAAIQPALPGLQMIGALIGGVIIVNLGLLISAIGALALGVAAAMPYIVQALAGFVQYWSGAFQFIGALIGFFVHLVTGKFNLLGQDLANMGAGIVSMLKGVWNIATGLFMGAAAFIGGVVVGLVNNVIRLFTGLWDTLVGHSIIPDMILAIQRWFVSLPGRVIGALVSLVNMVTDKIGGLANQAATWGSNIAKFFADGILSGIETVKNAAGQVMQAAADFMKPGSPTKEGIGKTLMTWGPNLVGHYASTMLDALPTLEAAANITAKTAMEPLASSSVSAAPPTSTVRSGNTSISISVTAPGRTRDEANEIADQIMRRLDKELNRSGTLVSWAAGGRS